MSPGVVAAIHLAGVRGEPCGAVRWTATTPGLMVRILKFWF